MTRTRLCAATAVALAMLVCLSAATAQTFQGFLDGLQEVPPNVSPGFGSVDATVDNTGAFLIIAGGGTYSGLLGGAIAVSLNDAAVGSNGPVIFGLTLDTPGAATGTFQGGGMLTPTQVADMIAGNTYINIRSAVFPSGEIRGQLTQVPEPSTLVILGVGSLGMLLAAWRRRNRAA